MGQVYCINFSETGWLLEDPAKLRVPILVAALWGPFRERNADVRNIGQINWVSINPLPTNKRPRSSVIGRLPLWEWPSYITAAIPRAAMALMWILVGIKRVVNRQLLPRANCAE